MRNKKSEHEEVEDGLDVPTPFRLSWVKDTAGRQGEVLFDGKLYWQLVIDKTTGHVAHVGLSKEMWAARNEDLSRRRSKSSK